MFGFARQSMVEEPESDPAPSTAPPTPTRRRGRVLALSAFVVALLLGAGGGFWVWLNAGSTPESTKDTTPEPARGLVALEPFLVNLADGGGSRFLRVTLRLLVDDEAGARTLEEDPVAIMQVRSALLELLTVQTADSLITPDGKASLKTAIQARLAALPIHLKVHDVLFVEFVVQF